MVLLVVRRSALKERLPPMSYLCVVVTLCAVDLLQWYSDALLISCLAVATLLCCKMMSLNDGGPPLYWSSSSCWSR